LAAWLLSMETGRAAPAAGVAALPGGPVACNGENALMQLVYQDSEVSDGAV
jgi:hypothetical protein